MNQSEPRSEIPEIKRPNKEVLVHLSQLEAVQKICGGLRTAQQLDEILPLFASETMTALDAAAVTVWLYDPPTGELHQVAGYGFPSLRTRLKPGEGITGQVFATGQAHVSSEFKTDPLTSDTTRELVPLGLGGAAVPIRAGDEVIGVLFASVLWPREFTTDQLSLLNIVSDIAGVGIHRAHLLAQSKRRLERYAALQTIDMAITASSDPAVSLNILLDQAMVQLNVDATSILRFNPQSQVFEGAVTRGFVETWERAGLNLETYLHRVVEEKRAVHIPNLAQALGKPESDPSAVDGFVTYYAVPIMIKGQCQGILEILNRRPLLLQPEWLAYLETLVWHAAIVIENSMRLSGQASTIAELSTAVDAMAEAWARSVELREGEVEGHTLQLAEMTVRLAQAVGIPEANLVHVRRGALLHDLGKLGLPDSLLFKPSSLSQEEWVLMRKHPLYAYNLLYPISQLRPALEIPYCHHERWDGTGYPHGLAGESIPLSARAFAVVDVWDAFRSQRVFRPAWPDHKILKRIQGLAGTVFDPMVVEKFMAMIEQAVPQTQVLPEPIQQTRHKKG